MAVLATARVKRRRTAVACSHAARTVGWRRTSGSVPFLQVIEAPPARCLGSCRVADPGTREIAGGWSRR